MTTLYDPSTQQWYDYNDTGMQNKVVDPEMGYTAAVAEDSGALTPATPPPGQAAAPNLINPTQSDPHAIASQLLLSQFQEWQSTYQPVEKALMNELSFNNPSILTDAVSQAKEAATGSASTMRGILDRENKAMGIDPTQGQQDATNRILDVTGSENIAGAQNKARAAVRQQDESILLGSVPNQNIVKGAIG